MLADSVKTSGNVIMLADAVSEGTGRRREGRAGRDWRDPGYTPWPMRSRDPMVSPPYQSLTDAAASRSATTSSTLDPGRPGAADVAVHPESTAKYLPSLGVAAALAAGGVPPADVDSARRRRCASATARCRSWRQRRGHVLRAGRTSSGRC